MFVNGQGRDEYANPSKHIEGDIYEAKMRSAGELDNLLDAGTNFRNEPDGRDGHVHPDVIGGFDYYDTIFKIGDRYYEAVINIKNVKNGKLFKDVTKIKDVTQDVMSSYGHNPKSQFLRTSSTRRDTLNERGQSPNISTSSNNSISQNDENTTENRKYSFSGVNAQTANQSQLQIAMQMEENEATSEEIRKETGWHRGYDNKC